MTTFLNPLTPLTRDVSKKALSMYIFSFYINIPLLDVRTLHEMFSNLSSFCLLHQAKMEILGFRSDGWSVYFSPRGTRRSILCSDSMTKYVML